MDFNTGRPNHIEDYLVDLEQDHGLGGVILKIKSMRI